MREISYRIPKPICLTLFIVLKVQTFLVLLSILLHDFKSQAFFFALCTADNLFGSSPRQSQKRDRAREGKYSEWHSIFYHSLKQSG